MNNPVITPIDRFFRLLKVDQKELVNLYIYAVFNGLIALSLPVGIQALINLISGGQLSTSWYVLVFIVIGGVGLNGLMQILQISITEDLQRKIFTRSAFEFAYRIPRMKQEAVEKLYIPEMANRFFDTLTLQKGLSKVLLEFSTASLQVLMGLILLCLYHPFFILFAIVLLLLLYFIFRITAERGLNSSLKESKFKYKVAHWLQEVARAKDTFKLAGVSPLPLDNTDEVVKKYLDARKTHFKTLVFQYINLVGFKVLIAAGLLIIGSLLVVRGQMNIGQFVASEIVIILILASVEKLILTMETIYDVLTAIEKLGAVADIPLEADHYDGHHELTNEGMTICLEKFNFSPGDKRGNFAMKDVTLNIESGDKICLTGSHGSGKSLMLQVLSGLYEKFEGGLIYDKAPVGSWNRAQLRAMIGDNLAREDVFMGTLKQNITLGRDHVSKDELHDILEVVGLTDYVKRLPKGVDTQLLSEARDLPKSVRIQLMLARCLVGHPRLILLEDNFHLLDPAIKNRFLEYVLCRDWTVVAVSSDPAIFNRFTRIITMDNGSIVGETKGTDSKSC